MKTTVRSALCTIMLVFAGCGQMGPLYPPPPEPPKTEKPPEPSAAPSEQRPEKTD